MDGAGITRLLRDPGAEIDSTVFAELALKTQHPGAMIRQGRYKYSYYVGDMDELYDLGADPAEMKNLAPLAAYRQKRDELKEQLFAWHNPEKEVG